MTKFIEITTPNGHAALINVNNILWIVPTIPEGKTKTGGNCCISCGGDNVVYAVETAREIMEMINP